MTTKILHFTDLIAWKEAHRTILFIYKITKSFPKEEFFRLTDQLCRSASSIAANISEGFSRNTQKEKRQFYHVSLGSLTETQNHIMLSKDLGYISEKDFDCLMKDIILISKLINGLIKSANNKAS